MPNGQLATRIVQLMEKRPVWALIFMLLTFVISGGGISYGVSFLGQGSKISSEVAELIVQNNYTKSAIKQETKDRIREITQLKEDGKLLSEASIRLIIFEELRKSEDRIIKRLNSN